MLAMPGNLEACGNDTGSPSMSKAEDNLSNSDGPLLKRNVRRNSNSSMRLSSDNVNGTMIVSRGMSPSDEKHSKKRYCLWTLTVVLAILGLCNLLLSIRVIAVLRISQGMEAMEVIPDENLVKFYGRTDLDRVCLRSGVCQGYGDEPMEASGDEAGVRITVSDHRTSRPSVEVLANGTTVSRVESFEVKDPRSGAALFTTDFPNFGLPSGVARIDAKIAETHRVASPINDSLTLSSDAQMSVQGAEGVRIDSREIVWSADRDVFLKSVNGSIVLDARDGVSIGVDDIPVAPMFLHGSAAHDQYKVCVCMPQGKLFRVPVRSGAAGARSTNCAHVARTPESDPCSR